MRDRSYIPELDGLRGFAIVLVLAFHAAVLFEWSTPTEKAWLRVVDVGRYSVDLFFVLSGFLITRILINAREQEHSLGHFYLRRALRIFPVYYLFLLSVLVINPLLGPDYDLRGVTPEVADGIVKGLGGKQAFLWGYLANVLVWIQGKQIYGLNHLWSLSLEEQYYLIWPAVVYRLQLRRLAWLACIVCAAALGFRLWHGISGSPLAILEFAPFARMDGIAAGSAIAVFWHSRPQLLQRAGRFWWPACLVLLALVAALEVLSKPDEIRRVAAVAHVSLFVAVWCCLLAALLTREGPLNRLLSCRSLRSLGKYSYAMYLVHWPLFGLAEGYLRLGDHPAFRWPSRLTGLLHCKALACAVFLCALGAISLALAVASWHLVEKHFLRLKNLFPMSPRASRPLRLTSSDPGTGW